MSSKNIGLTWSLSVGPITGSLFKVLVDSDYEPPSTIVFKVPLQVAVKNSYRFDTVGDIFIPNIVTSTIDWLNQHEAYKSDIFLEKGDPETVLNFKHMFNTGMLETIPENANSNDVASLLHLWLSELDGELIPKKCLGEFKRLHELPKKDHRKALKDIIDKLPPENLSTLKMIIDLFCKIVSNSYLIDSALLGSLISITLRHPYSVLIRHAARNIFDQESIEENGTPRKAAKKPKTIRDEGSPKSKDSEKSLKRKSEKSGKKKKETKKKKIKAAIDD